jgi:hypothetical protein
MTSKPRLAPACYLGPAYYLGRPASLWLAALAPRKQELSSRRRSASTAPCSGR